MKKSLINIGLILSLGGILHSCGGTSSNSGSNNFDTSKNITLYTRDTASGTRDGFFTGIGLSTAKEDDAPLKSVTTTNGNGDMMQKVANDEYGIGYCSLSTVNTIDGIKALKYNDVTPSQETVLDGTYKLTRNFNYIKCATYDDAKMGEIIDAFIAYMSTIEGKSIIAEEGGIVEITADDLTIDELAKEHPILNEDLSKYTIKTGGSTSVQDTAHALLEAFKAETKVNYTQDCKGSGDAFLGTQGTNAGKFDIAFASREFELTTNEQAADGTYGKLAIDAIVAIVNEENPYEKTDAKSLVEMYSKDGEYTTWADVLDE